MVALAAIFGLAYGRCADVALAARTPSEVPRGWAAAVLYAAAFAGATAFTSPLVALTVVTLAEAARADLLLGRIPNEIVAVGACGAVVLRIGGGLPLAAPVLAAAAAAGVLLVVRLLGTWSVGQPGMGLGDVKLGAALGLLVGWPVLWGLYLAAALVAAVAVGARATAGRLGLAGSFARSAEVPFAPFIAAGAVLARWVPLPW